MDETAAPTFLFAITMQNHQPYDGIDPSLMQIEVSSDKLSEPAMQRLSGKKPVRPWMNCSGRCSDVCQITKA